MYSNVFTQLAVLNTEGYEDTVVWNPYGNEGMGFNNFVCVESVKVSSDARCKRDCNSWRSWLTHEHSSTPLPSREVRRGLELWPSSHPLERPLPRRLPRRLRPSLPSKQRQYAATVRRTRRSKRVLTKAHNCSTRKTNVQYDALRTIIRQPIKLSTPIHYEYSCRKNVNRTKPTMFCT